MVFSERLDLPSILLFMGIGQMLLLVGFLLLKKPSKNDKSTIFLILSLIALSINLLEPALIQTRFLQAVPHLLYIGPGFFLLLGPLALWQFFALKNPGFKWDFRQLIHAIPFVFVEARVFPLFLQSAEEKRVVISQFYMQQTSGDIVENTISFQALFTQLHPIIYLCVLLHLGRALLRQQNERLTPDHLRYFTAFLITLILHLFGNWVIPVINIGGEALEWPLMSVPLYLFVCYAAYLILTGRMVPNTTRPALKRDHKANALHQQLLKYMDDESPYLNSEISLSGLAHAVDIPAHLLSKVINEFEDRNFHDFINGYRTEAAKRLITDPAMNHYTLEAIAQEAGFSNKMSFNRAFKKHCGVTPSEYRGKMKNA